jgi:two-component system, LytTR family, sensor kinase
VSSAAGPAASRPNASFWTLQVGGWLAFGAAMALSRLGTFPLGYMAATKGVLTLTGLVTSLGLRAVYRRLLRRGVTAQGLIAAALAASCVGSLVWTPAANALAALVTRGGYRVGASFGAPLLLFDGVAYHAVALLAWSLLYLGITHHEALQAERERSLRAEALAHRARLQALRYQLQPHFLFNTLNAVSTLVVEHRTAEAGRMIARLSDFLRLTLDGADAEEVLLDEEIEFVRRYLEIERVRFGERLAVSIDVEPEAGAARVPSMILQPIVENAVRHAVARNAEGGRLSVSAARVGGVLRLAVADDGPGLAGRPAAGEGIGLTNTRERLRQAYGDAHRLELLPGEGGGVRAVLELPFRSANAVVPRVERDAQMAVAAPGGAGERR